MHEDTIFLPSDLAGSKRTEILRVAREGAARIRDKDGTSLVMLPEAQVASLQFVAEWSGNLLRLQELLARGGQPTVGDLGELAWLRGFDRDDLQEFADELHQVLIASIADGHGEALDATVRAWRTTAKEIEDPLRRSILTGELSPGSLVDADRP